MTWRLAIAMSLNCAIVALTIGAYASRLAGARTGRVATAISLFNLFATAGRLASMLYTPILGALADNASRHPALAAGTFLWQLRAIVFAGAAGAALGTLCLPAFVTLYARAISAFERTGSIPRAALALLSPRTWLRLLPTLRPANPAALRSLPLGRVPKDVLVLNVLVTSVYGIGIVAAAYASVLNPAAARTALLSSGLVNGLATIAYNVVVDPVSALVTDQAVRGERPIADVRALVASLSLTSLAGFLLSQALLIPAAWVLVRASTLVSGH